MKLFDRHLEWLPIFFGFFKLNLTAWLLLRWQDSSEKNTRLYRESCTVKRPSEFSDGLFCFAIIINTVFRNYIDML
ncbi:hypothetical protein l11_09880 [Neisseria weaveri LMG 5135]|nr:hypothetical protein l11_09880 [Neisseria weaveri LMG 5135]